MTATNHVVTGALIGAAIHQPLLALPIAVMSHLGLDALPHFGMNIRRTELFSSILLLDILSAAAILGAIWIVKPEQWLLMIACGIASASLDIMWIPLYVQTLKKRSYKLRHWYEKLHASVQWSQTPRGLVIELLWFGLFFTVLIRFFSHG